MSAVRVQRGAMQVEEVEKDLGAMTMEQQRAAVMADAPELAALLADLQSSLAEVRSRVGPLLKEVSAPLLFCEQIDSHTRHSHAGAILQSTDPHITKQEDANLVKESIPIASTGLACTYG